MVTLIITKISGNTNSYITYSYIDWLKDTLTAILILTVINYKH